MNSKKKSILLKTVGEMLIRIIIARIAGQYDVFRGKNCIIYVEPNGKFLKRISR